MKRDYEILIDITKSMRAEISNNKKNYFDNLAEKLCDSKMNRKSCWDDP